MDLLFILPNIGYGGASKILAFVANSLSKSESYHINILVYENTDILQDIDSRVKIHFITKKFNKVVIKRLQYLREIYAAVKEINPDLIISFLNFPNLYSVIVGKLLSIPVIISERGDPYQRKKKFDHCFDIIYNMADGAVFQTPGAKSYFGKKLQKRSIVIPNPIVRNHNNITRHQVNDSHKIAFVGRFELKQKRQDIMLRSFAYVKEKYPDAELNFYGNGPDEEYAKSLADKLGVGRSVIFHGYTKDVCKEIADSEVFVMTSDYEGIPNALIEAMMIGMPVVSTDCSPGGAKLLIKDNYNGIIVKQGDSKEVSDAVIRIFSSPELKKHLSQNAEKLDEDFLPDKIIKQWEEYIKTVYNRYNR